MTQLLARWRTGDKAAENELFEQIYPLLRGLARRELAGNGPLTLQPTELAHDAYIKLAGQYSEWANREQFMAVAGRVVRRVVIDYLRQRQAAKRGSGDKGIALHNLEESQLPAMLAEEDLLRLDRVLEELEEFDPESARLVEQRYFAGMTVVEIAVAWERSEATVARQWRVARAWLRARLSEAGN